MKVADFDYQLPESLIATHPAEPRDHSRLMVVDRKAGTWDHQRFHELDQFLRPGDLLVLNNTKVIPARIFGTDSNDRKFEVFLLKPVGTNPSRWICLARPGRKVKGEVTLRFDSHVTGIIHRRADAEFEIRFPDLPDTATFFPWIERTGVPPLPPYIKRPATEEDRKTYQTVFAKENGSVAAPTAGLHFSESLLERIRQRGIATAEVTLHVGYGTFAPIQVTELEKHVMHEEIFSVPPTTLAALEQTKKRGGRIIAVGTTALRALESIPTAGLSGATSIFIQPGYRFSWVDGLITNFHLPQSTLLVLVAAFLGLDKVRRCYEEAIREKYRFYSYGDAMAIL